MAGHAASWLLACACALGACAAPVTVRAGTPPPRVLFRRGLYLETARGDLEEAVALYRAIRASLRPGDELVAETLVREGICLEKMGRGGEALACYRALEGAPNSAAIAEKAFGEMAIFFSRPAMVHARDKELERLLGEAANCLERGDRPGARDRLRTALLIDPDNKDLQLRLARVCRSLGEYREAVFYYTMAAGAGSYGGDPAVLRELASCYSALDDHDGAVKIWRGYAEGEPAGTRDRRRAAYEIELILEAKEAPDALPEGLADLLAQGEAKSRAGRYRAACTVYDQARLRFPASYLPPLRLGVLCDRLLEDSGRDSVSRAIGGPEGRRARLEKAAGYYEEAVDKAPLATAQRLRCRLALLHEQLGDLEKASYHLAQYYSHPVRPVEGDGILMDRIRKKRMAERIRRLREKP